MMYQLGEVARAAGESPETVKLWLSRGYLVMRESDREAAGAGRVRLFSFETAMQIAVGAELHRKCHLPVRRAMDAAISFAHFGDAARRHRRPGRPYGIGDTYLMVSGDHDLVVCHDSPGADLKLLLPPTMWSAFTAVNAGTVYHRAAAALGGDPRGDWRDQADGLMHHVRLQDAILAAKSDA